MKYSVKFYLEKRSGITENIPINLNVTFDGKRMDYFTGKRCNLEQWTGENVKTTKQNPLLANGQSTRDFNSDLSRIKLAVEDLFKIYEIKNKYPSVIELRSNLKLKLGKKVTVKKAASFFDRYRQYIDETFKSTITNKCDKSFIKKLQKFKPDLTYESCDIQFLTDYHSYLIKTQNLSENSASTILSRLRTFIKYSINREWTDKTPFINYTISPKIYGDPIYLTIEERDKLFNANIEDEILASTRDTFLLQCLLGCRIGDLFAMTKSNIIKGNIEYIASKTKDNKPITAVVPLTAKAIQIIEKYNLPDGRLVPFVLLINLNKRIKRVLRKVGITRMVTVPDKKTRKSKQVPICNIVSTHMARRVFIGGLIKKGVLIPIISSMSGHSKDSRAFGRYYQIDNDDQKAAISLIE